MKLAIGQLNPTIADLENNVKRCVAAAKQAKRFGADVLILPELVIPGSPARDILLDASFIQAIQAANADFAHLCKDLLPVVAGSVAVAEPTQGSQLFNTLFLFENGNYSQLAQKHHLRSDNVFFEPRWFSTGSLQKKLVINGQPIGCYFYDDLRINQTLAEDALVVACSASHFQTGIMAERMNLAKKLGKLCCVANLVGANDALVYDGRSFLYSPNFGLVGTLNAFEEDLQVRDTDNLTGCKQKLLLKEDELIQAIVLGISDFFKKNNLDRAYIGLSGGVDSTLVAVLAVMALGRDAVMGVAMPSRHTDPRSTQSALQLSQTLGIKCDVVSIEPLHKAFEAVLGEEIILFNTDENIQARIRAMLLLGYTNRYGGVVINTSNKTELSLGYGTINGDLSGSICPIGDLTKPEVYQLAHYLNQKEAIIPEFILTREPTAELKPNQVDPFDYAVVSPKVEAMISNHQSNEMIRKAENKRQHLGIVIKLKPITFGRGRMMPVTRK